jgi:hypothetical protein
VLLGELAAGSAVFGTPGIYHLCPPLSSPELSQRRKNVL